MFDSRNVSYYAVALQVLDVNRVAYRFGYVNSFGVSEPPILAAQLQLFIVILNESLFQVFQEYYENTLLKGTSPSTMYVMSESCFCFSDIQYCRLLVPG